MNEPSLPEAMSSAELAKELASNASLLVKRQVKLAQLELKGELRKGKLLAGMLGAAGALAYAGFVLLCGAAALGIGVALGDRYWAGALIVGGALLIGAAIVGGSGWARRIRKPLERSRAELTKEITWARYRTT